jgi:alanyl-tRNA synthetase
MKTAEIRRRFLQHFIDNGHVEVPSASLIFDDPNLLFVGAGMVPFVPYFLGHAVPEFNRAVSVQKCVRTGDIEEVGKTTRHGTFFQMNGNFSFGDYFKAEAIRLAWDLITKSQDQGGFGIDPETIWVTIYLDDDETADLWKAIGVPPERIQRRGMVDNYWSMGIPGPCGPNSEIYVDRGPAYGPDGGPIVDEDRFLEIWNLVFMQNIRGEGGAKDNYPILGDLPKKNIDTGMGLERVAYLLQGVDNLYEIDEVFPVLEAAARMAGVSYGGGETDDPVAHEVDVRLRVVADHVRSSMMLIADGVKPGNEARGYVVRRLLRRAVRSMRLLGVEEPVLPVLMPISRDLMQASYPELASTYDRIADIAYAEEQAFRQTLRSGTTIFDTAVDEVRSAGGNRLEGDRAFALHDTYGFPIDLTLEMAGEAGLTVDTDGFRRLMDEQKQRAKSDARSRKHAHADLSVYTELAGQGPSEFVGYSTLRADSAVRGLLRDGAKVPVISEGETVQVVLARTPFYAESGGQIADEGVIRADGVELAVRDVQKPVKGLIVHTVDVVRGELTDGSDVLAEVDGEWRLSACQAHSGTHIVHAALRQVLGPTALQSGSYNKPGYLRLDFAWTQGLSADLRAEIEDVSNVAVRHDLPVSAQIMPLRRARELGALALFGETYDADVRVVEIGGEWSRELCGGTHVSHSSQVGALTITGESSVGAGVRRLEALVGLDALRYLGRERALVSGLTDLLKVQPEQLTERVSDLVARLRVAERQLEQQRAQSVLASAGRVAEGAEDIDGIAFASFEAPSGTSAGDLRKVAVDVRDRLGEARPGVAVVVADTGGKPGVVVATTAAGRDRGLLAGALVRTAAETLGGKGGGRDDVAQGGGSDTGRLADAVAAVRALVVSGGR